MHKILFLVSIEHEQLRKKLGKKGAQAMLIQRDELGYFDHVYHVGFPTSKTQTIRLNPRHTIIEISKEKFKFLRNLKFVFNLLNTISFLIYVKHLIQKEKIDIIRAIDAREQALFAYALSKITKIPWCVSIHSDYDKGYKLAKLFKICNSRIAAKKIERFVLHRALLVMPIRKILGDKAIQWGASQKAVRLIPHGINLNNFSKVRNANEILAKYCLGGSRKIIFSAGRLSRENYVYDILEIVKSILKMREDILFVAAGDGPEKNKIDSEIQKGNLSNFIKLLGFITLEDVYRLRMASCINLCLMGGFSLIEACASGKPVIAYDVDWHYELIKDGETGFLIREGDVECVVEKINYLFENQKLAQKMGVNAKRLAFERHSIDKTSKLKSKCYKELLEKYGKYKAKDKD